MKPNRLKRYYKLSIFIPFIIILLFPFSTLSFITQTLAPLIFEPSPAYNPPTGNPVRIQINTSKPIQNVSPKYLSFAIDTSLIIGGHWWSDKGHKEFSPGSNKVDPINLLDPKLIALTKKLSPAYIRIGGTEADNIIFSQDPVEITQTKTLTADQWDSLQTFINLTKLDLFFTVNAGPATRDINGFWKPDNLEDLLKHAHEHNHRIEVLELGNEINGFWLTQGFFSQINGTKYSYDFRTFHQITKNYYPKAKLAGPASAYWTLIGESYKVIMDDFLHQSHQYVDIITWHYYPQQSKRCPLAIRKAKPELLFNPSYLDEISKWATSINQSRDRFHPTGEIWLGETGHAQCGGQPNLSETYASSVWWADQLGILATHGHQIIIRQTLIGSNYGLLDQQTLEPRPDYWISFYWKKLMGQQVLQINRSTDNDYLRAYAHCHPNANHPTLLLINTNTKKTASVQLDLNQMAEIYQFSSPDQVSILLNQAPPTFETPPITSKVDGTITVPPLNILFISFPQLDIPACTQ